MRFNKLDLNLLIALDALLTERNVSRAAARVHLTQSALSNALSRLREYFNDDLLTPVGRRFELTPRAEALKDVIRDLLVRIDSALATQPDFEPTTSDREFILFVSDYTMTMLMPRVLDLARQQGSNVRFKLLPQIAEPYRALERAEVDLLVIPTAYCSPDHPTEIALQEDFVCAVWSGSAIAHSGELTLQRYADAGHVVMQPADTSQPSFEKWHMERYGLSRRIAVSTYSITAMPHLLVGTEFIATVHKRLALKMLPALPLKLFPLPLSMPALDLAIQWHKLRSQDPGLVWLRSLLMRAAAALDQEPAALVNAQEHP
ncbi:LysR family transcriptional regulator [Azohydromonas australica]|uniref:LysR family transcriptional regulator n=1 Tax=Azohydromonas australica TaxID=364039 RepID=UPI000412597C|nr:LysR family transcriptional regulator [Azohydromonas australica]